MQKIQSVPSLGRRRLFSVALATLLLVAVPAAWAQDEAESVDGLRLSEITLARNIEGGQAIDPTTTFSSADARVWVVTESDVPGLVTEADTLPDMERKLVAMIPELLELNAPESRVRASSRVPFDLIAHKHVGVSA